MFFSFSVDKKQLDQFRSKFGNLLKQSTDNYGDEKSCGSLPFLAQRMRLTKFFSHAVAMLRGVGEKTLIKFYVVIRTLVREKNS